MVLPSYDVCQREETSWLFTIEDEDQPIVVGADFSVWTTPPRTAATGLVRRRRDGLPYHPRWQSGDAVFVFHPGLARCVAELIVEEQAEWAAEEQLLWTPTRVAALDLDGPTLADIGVERALQGGRHRLTAEQRDAARRRLGNGS